MAQAGSGLPGADELAALRESEEWFRLLAEAMPQIVCVLGPAGAPEYVNPSWVAFSGLDLAATVRLGWEGIVHPDDLPAAAACRRRALETLAPQDVELRYRAADGGWRWFLSRLAPMVERGRVVRLIGAGMDIEDRRRADAALRESGERLRLALEAGQMGTFDIDLAAETVVTTAMTERLFGFPGEEGGGPRPTSRYFSRVHPDDAARVTAALRAALEGREHVVEYRVVHPGGATRWLHSRGAVLRDAQGRPLRLHGAIVDVTSRREAEEALREAGRRKDEFIGMLSHELRNPLAPIRSAVHLLRHAEGTEQARRAREVIERQTEHLTRLVDDLLDVTRIARGKIELRRGAVDLGELVRRAADDLRGAFEGGGVSLRVSAPRERLVADADATRLAQVIGNLLHNAAKFTPAGGEVAVVLRRGPSGAELSVADTGAGIAATLLPRVFEPFVQGERGLARTDGGLGLGLALVKGLVELHGGSVDAESGGEGRGTTVTVRLPLAGARLEEAPAPERRAEARCRRVLVVDDNRDAADTLAQLVELLGHEVEVAYDGAVALARLQERRPDVVLCDLGLPGIDGYEVARRIRASAGSEVRLFAVSGYAQPEDVARAAEAGFDGHVPKPPDPGRIEEVLR